jgi:FAD/FMN-containing dehydrogenase
MANAFTEHGAKEVFSTSDPEEGEAFVAARRFAIPAVEAKGSLLLEDVGVPLPALADLVGGVAKIAADHDLMISVIAIPVMATPTRSSCTTPPIKRWLSAPRRRSAKSWIWRSGSVAPSPASTASAG